MKSLISSLILVLLFSCSKDPENPKSLLCDDYWSAVAFSDFCGLSMNDFDFNSVLADICNADQKATFAFDDLISIRVFNHFQNDLAREEYDAEKADAQSLPEYVNLTLGDDAFGLITTEFGKLDFAIIQVVKDTYTIYLEVNGNSANGSNNCFNETSVVTFARALAAPL